MSGQLARLQSAILTNILLEVGLGMAKATLRRTAQRPSKPSSRRTAVSPRAKKISITVDEQVLAAVEREARRAGRSLSAQVTGALARDLRRTRLEAIIHTYEAEHGTIRADELERIRSEWQD
jgi:hypothetical protein